MKLYIVTFAPSLCTGLAMALLCSPLGNGSVTLALWPPLPLVQPATTTPQHNLLSVAAGRFPFPIQQMVVEPPPFARGKMRLVCCALL